MADRLQVLSNHLKGNISLNKVSAAKFKYTLDDCSFSLEQRIQYENNGFIVFRKLVPDDILDQCSKRFVEVCEGRVPKGGMTLMKDLAFVKKREMGQPLEYVYNKVQDIVWDDVFSKYILYPKVLDIVENITGPNIMAMHSMLINKPPDAGTLTSRHPLHQDLHYFAFRPAERVVAAWTAMEKITRQNGCLVVLPTTHNLPLLEHNYPKWKDGVNKGFFGVEGFDDHDFQYLEMEKGDTVFFHPLLIHGSGPNLTKGMRKAISCHYAASECHYVDVTGTSQDNIAEEVREIARKRGLILDFEEFWKFRNRLARGKMINL